MIFARFRALSGLLLLAAFGTNIASGGSPLAGLMPFERVDANPQNAYPLTEDNGPWLIMVTTLQGPKAEENARALTYELRKAYKLTAYTHRMTFDHSEAIGGRGLNRFGGQQRMRNRQASNDEVAVLVGNFNSVEDPRAQKALEQIKNMRPKSLEEAGLEGAQAFDALRSKVLPDGKQRNKKGPLRLAFVTTNPLLPEGYYHPKGVDRVVAEMNEGVKHSLLDCPGRYTVKVATFSGNVVIDPRRLQEIEEKRDAMKSRLMEAAEKAHEVTVFLRAKGFEAYEYHDRHSSIVTVGSFESPGQQDASGGYVFSPEVQEKIDRFRAKPRRNHRTGAVGPVTPEYIETLKIYLDPQPLVIEVPRRSFGSDYARAMVDR